MKSQLPALSALLDGELEPHEYAQTLDRLAGDEELRETWGSYVLIRDQLRQDSLSAPDLSVDIMAKIRQEPVVFAPRNLRTHKQQHPVWALAASVAGVAVVGWLGFSSNLSGDARGSHVAAVLPAPTLSQTAQSQPLQVEPATAKATPNTNGDLSEYLLAHHTQASAFRFGDSAGSIRTVSLPGTPGRP